MVHAPDTAVRLGKPAPAWFAVWLASYRVVVDPLDGGLSFSFAGGHTAEDIDATLEHLFRMLAETAADRKRRVVLIMDEFQEVVDIDPGLTQLWISTGQLRVAPHDVYFTIGETVGTPKARFPDCGLRWVHIRPPVYLELWPYIYAPRGEAFTTVAGWWSGKWVKVMENGNEVCRDNNKRVAFLDCLELPRMTPQSLELALLLADGDVEDRCLLERRGWRVRDAREVASTPARYQAYIQGSRGEWSCAKPFFVKLQNAWVSDRTVCYLASGKPAVVQHTGPSAYLPDGEGMFRFSTLEGAAAALDAINADYQRHCRAAREIAAAYFDAKHVLGKMLSEALP